MSHHLAVRPNLLRDLFKSPARFLSSCGLQNFYYFLRLFSLIPKTIGFTHQNTSNTGPGSAHLPLYPIQMQFGVLMNFISAAVILFSSSVFNVQFPLPHKRSRWSRILHILILASFWTTGVSDIGSWGLLLVTLQKCWRIFVFVFHMAVFLQLISY